MIVLEGGTLVELRPRRVRRNARIVIDGTRIVAVGESAEAPAGAVRIDCGRALVMPGLVCAHTHLYSALARGMPPAVPSPTSFVEILERVWWKLDRALDDEALEVSALLGAVEALRAGTTTLIDHHASPSRIAGSLDIVGAAVEKIGLRGALCYEVTDRHGPEGARAGIVENDRFLASLGDHSARPLLRGLVGAHAGFTLSHDTTVALADVAVRRDTGVHIHVAEDRVDARHTVPARDATIVEWLDEYRLLGPRAVLAHCVHVDDAGAERMRAAGARIVHNPRSNMNNAVGYAHPARFAGPNLCLGTDGIGADMLAEAHVAFLAARHSAWAAQSPTPESTGAIDPLAMLAANQSLAASLWDAGIGRLEPGCPADVIVVDYDPPTPLDENNLFGHLVFGVAAGAGAVRDVIIDGRVRMRDRTLVEIDERRLRARAREAAAKLWARMAAL